MKTNFLNKLKQGLFLLIAVLGTFFGYAQQTSTTFIQCGKIFQDGERKDVHFISDQITLSNPLKSITHLQVASVIDNLSATPDIGGRDSGAGGGYLVFTVFEIGGKNTGGGTGTGGEQLDLCDIGGRSQEPTFSFKNNSYDISADFAYQEVIWDTGVAKIEKVRHIFHDF